MILLNILWLFRKWRVQMLEVLEVMGGGGGGGECWWRTGPDRSGADRSQSAVRVISVEAVSSERALCPVITRTAPPWHGSFSPSARVSSWLQAWPSLRTPLQTWWVEGSVFVGQGESQWPLVLTGWSWSVSIVRAVRGLGWAGTGTATTATTANNYCQLQVTTKIRFSHFSPPPSSLLPPLPPCLSGAVRHQSPGRPVSVSDRENCANINLSHANP